MSPAIHLDENGLEPEGTPFSFTGTNSDGTPIRNTCPPRPRSHLANQNPVRDGLMGGASLGWCGDQTNKLHLYCFEQYPTGS